MNTRPDTFRVSFFFFTFICCDRRTENLLFSLITSWQLYEVFVNMHELYSKTTSYPDKRVVSMSVFEVS